MRAIYYFYTLTFLITSIDFNNIQSKPTSTEIPNKQPLTRAQLSNKTKSTIKQNESPKKTKSKKKTNQGKIKQANNSFNKIVEKQIPSLQTKTVEQKNKSSANTITVQNNITSEMLCYKHWSGTHEPSFMLSINGKKIEQGKQEEIVVTDNNLEIRYDYSFVNGFRKGAKIVSCIIEKGAKDVGIEFSWDSEWHIKTDNAHPQEVKIDPFIG